MINSPGKHPSYFLALHICLSVEQYLILQLMKRKERKNHYVFYQVGWHNQNFHKIKGKFLSSVAQFLVSTCDVRQADIYWGRV